MGKLRRKILRRVTKLAVKSVKKGAMKYASDSARETIEKYKESISPRTYGSITLRTMRNGDRKEVLEMMQEFYSSEATLTSGSDKIFNNDITECLSDRPFLEGYVFAYKDSDNSLWGYAMTAQSFSTEFGKRCIWIEDLYLREEVRGMGLASHFIEMLEEKYPDSIFRLEAEYENGHAMDVYRRRGFREFPYVEMIRDSHKAEEDAKVVSGV